eukprot:66463_1
MDPQYPTNFWTGEQETAFHVKGQTKPNVLVNKGAQLVEMDPKFPVNYWTDEHATAIDVKGSVAPNVLVKSGVLLVETEPGAQVVDVKGQTTKKALVQTAKVQCVETDAKTREYEVTGATHSVAQLQPGALLVETGPESKVMDVQGTAPNKALIKTATVQVVETDAEYKEFEVSGPTFKVALVQKGATLVSLDPSVTVNYWTDEKEAVLDVTGDVKPQVKINQGVTMVEMDPEVVLNFWTNEYGAAYDVKGDIKPNVLLQGGNVQMMEMAPSPRSTAMSNGAAVMAIAKDTKAAQFEVEVKEIDEEDYEVITQNGINRGPYIKKGWSKWNEDMSDGIVRCLQILVDLNTEMASFKVNCNKSNIRKIGSGDVNQLVNQSSVFHGKMNKYHDIIRAMKVCSDAFIKNMEVVEEFIANEYIPDVAKYKEWKLDEMMVWIKSLDDGRFVKYLNRLLYGFKESDIASGDILPDLETADLAVPPFNIKNFRDKRDLIRHFKDLKGNKRRERSNTKFHNENPTDQDIMALMFEKNKAQAPGNTDVVYVKKKVQTLNLEAVKGDKYKLIYHD